MPVHVRFEAAVKLINTLSPAFVIDTGDVATHPVYGCEREYMQEFTAYKKYVAELKVPLYIVPGNHDIGYPEPQGPGPNGQPWGDYGQLVAAYQAEIGMLEQAFTYECFQFLLLNNNPLFSKGPAHLRAKQLDWLAVKLRQDFRSFVFCHIEVLFQGVGDVWGDCSQAMVDLCECYDVPMVAYGHRHEMHVVERNGIQYIMCPDLKVPGHQGLLEYHVYDDCFELYHHDIITRAVNKVGRYVYPDRSMSAR